MNKAILLAFALALGSAYAAEPAQKGKSAEKKPATPPARGGYDISKGGGATARKAPAAKAGQTSKPRQGLEANSSRAQGTEE